MKAGIDTELPVFIVLTDFHEYLTHPELFDSITRILEKSTEYSKIISDEIQVDMNFILLSHKPYSFDSEFLKSFPLEIMN